MRVIQPSVEVMTPLDGVEILKRIEECGRICYQSTHKITDDSYLCFAKNIINSGHESVIEHVSLTAKFICDRGVSHEIVRHRLASYCLSGDSMIFGASAIPYYKSKQWNVEHLWNMQRDNNLQAIPISSVDEDTKIISNTIERVTLMGEQDVYKIETRLGLSVTATSSHRFLTSDGYKPLAEITVGDLLACSNNHNVYYAPVQSITPAGTQGVYDIEMTGEPHNFIVNGIVSHNSQESTRYVSYGGNDGECTFIAPSFPSWQRTDNGEVPAVMNYWTYAMMVAEEIYQELIKLGASPQEARTVLPNSTKTEIVMTADLREWRHFLKLRTSKAAHPQIRELAICLLNKLKAGIPIIFDDIEVVT
jgi:thymidylate synthase ThyX